MRKGSGIPLLHFHSILSLYLVVAFYSKALSFSLLIWVTSQPCKWGNMSHFELRRCAGIDLSYPIYRDTRRYDIAYRFQNTDSLKVKCFISMTVSGKNRRVTVLMAVKHVLNIGSTRYSTHWLSQFWNGFFFVLFLNVTHVGWLCRVSLMLNEGWQFYKYGAVEGQMLLQKHWSTWSWLVQWFLLSLDWTRPGGNRFCNFLPQSIVWGDYKLSHHGVVS